jgi:myosin-5
MGPPCADPDIVSRILRSTPLLESFGNALTRRNDNSSRFGKFTQLQFDRDSRLVGAVCRTYLLETSRVTSPADGERNFHVFEQLLSAPLALRVELQLVRPDGLDNLHFPCTGRGVSETPTIHESPEALSRTLEALDLLNVSRGHQQSLLRLIAALLHLSALEFDGGEEACLTPTAVPGLTTVSDLLGLEAGELSLERTFCKRSMAAGGESYSIPRSQREAERVRDSLSRELYARLFAWLVRSINATTRARAPTSDSSTVHADVSILDIFGFESFTENGLEQFLINYTNERLQQQFTSDLFTQVADEYAQEGLVLPNIAFSDNLSVVKLIDSRFGMLAYLDEESSRAQASDLSLAHKFHRHFEGHPAYTSMPLRETAFKISHYAGPVVYETGQWLTKNANAVHADVLRLLGSSKEEQGGLLADLFPREEPTNGVSATRTPDLRCRPSVSRRFQLQLRELLTEIRETRVHYIR